MVTSTKLSIITGDCDLRSGSLTVSRPSNLNPNMSADLFARQVLARYSPLKVMGWVLLVLVGGIAILSDGLANKWRPPPGAIHPSFYLLGYGAAPFCVVIALAMLGNFVVSGGVAIARIGDQLVLYFPFSRKRISLANHFTAFATAKQIEAPAIYSVSWLRPPPALASQVTFAQAGRPDINFRTGLLTESADVVAARIAASIKARRP